MGALTKKRLNGSGHLCFIIPCTLSSNDTHTHNAFSVRNARWLRRHIVYWVAIEPEQHRIAIDMNTWDYILLELNRWRGAVREIINKMWNETSCVLIIVCVNVWLEFIEWDRCCLWFSVYSFLFFFMMVSISYEVESKRSHSIHSLSLAAACREGEIGTTLLNCIRINGLNSQVATLCVVCVCTFVVQNWKRCIQCLASDAA